MSNKKLIDFTKFTCFGDGIFFVSRYIAFNRKQAKGNSMITIADKQFCIENNYIKRELVFEDGSGLKTTSFYNKETSCEYAKPVPGCEFFVKLNRQDLFGYKKAQAHVLDGNIQKNDLTLTFMKAESTQKDNREQLSVIMKIAETGTIVTCCYEVADDQPGITKWLEIKAADSELKIEKLSFEAYNAYPGELPDILFYSTKDTGPKPKFFITDIEEDIIQAHNSEMNEGLFMCNDAAGPLKSFMVYPCWPDTALCAAYNNATVPFAKHLNPHEQFSSNKAYTMFYQGAHNSVKIRNKLRNFIRTQALPEYIKDDFMFCTWIPFLKNINTGLLNELIKPARDIGMTTFVLDDGWFTSENWAVDTEKFPNGLEEVSAAVRQAGMRFGLWFNIGTSYGNEGVNDDDSAEDATGAAKPHGGFFSSVNVKCTASKHIDLMTEKLIDLAQRYSVGYFKLDFSSIISPYGLLQTGCAGKNHKYHKDIYDSVYEQYAGMMRMRDAVHEKFPDLIIDFSFETFGTSRPNIAALQFSDLHHITNMNTKDETVMTARDIRNALYQLNKVLPVERILGSLICLQGEKATENFLTSLLGAPLMAGDLRQLDNRQKKQISAVTTRMSEITQHKPLTELEILRKDMPITRTDWDGFARYTRKGQGIICLFKNENSNSNVCLTIEDLPDAKTYNLTNILNQEISVSYGSEDFKNGITVEWPEHDNFMILEIS